MVKLATAREIRTYGPRLGRSRAEYINAGLYLFATVALIGGFTATGFSWEPRSGLVLILLALVLITAVNVHDLVAHLAGIDYRLRLMEYDLQLGLVEFAVPLVQIAGSVVFFLGIFFVFHQAETKRGYSGREHHALNLLIAGPLLWVIGSIHNSCQIYQRADSHVQILQQCVHIPFLVGSLLFLVSAVLNSLDQSGSSHSGLKLLGERWVWLGIAGAICLFVGGLMNVVKVFNFVQITGLRLEKLRGGAQDRLLEGREGYLPLVAEEERIRKMEADEASSRTKPRAHLTSKAGAGATETVVVSSPTPYKDVLVGQS
ncbi:hypothetical protein ARALYDRAFT_489270 [Arabidopsis lyrata subsp. lyrata]|uniref:Polypyrimidine tract-binding protein n=1 Tax=Arabidopsis lyrata subsp. lyrata TaxID=81972 RepID=D7M2H4_ARALL|nr:uncharacterized protein LOC9310238 [Arabidopsis lyrata subsp. lyrata]EFH48352.1 hypothetical protein ARALYDRAFT_489270 [Arabidopsis lyrata subsp. lyrata]|eukprot:XP_002872093.1 uncharacterized protein LOC9310238 [Arabidopsis lyrata subsp. lyrata]